MGAFLAILAASDGGGASVSLIVACIAAAAAIAGGALSYRASTKANAVSDRKVDLEEFRDQQARYKDMLAEADRHQDRLRQQLDRMTAQVDLVQAQIAREQDVSLVLRDQVRTLQNQVRTLERMIEIGPARRESQDRFGEPAEDRPQRPRLRDGSADEAAAQG